MVNKFILIIAIICVLLLLFTRPAYDHLDVYEHMDISTDQASCKNPTPTDIFYNKFASNNAQKKSVMFRCKLPSDDKYYYLSFIPVSACTNSAIDVIHSKLNNELYTSKCKDINNNYDCTNYTLGLVCEDQLKDDTYHKFVVLDMDDLSLANVGPKVTSLGTSILDSSEKRYLIAGVINNNFNNTSTEYVISQYLSNINNDINILCGVTKPPMTATTQKDLGIKVIAQTSADNIIYEDVNDRSITVKFSMDTITTSNCMKQFTDGVNFMTFTTFMCICPNNKDSCKGIDGSYKRICMLPASANINAIEFEPLLS